MVSARTLIAMLLLGACGAQSTSSSGTGPAAAPSAPTTTSAATSISTSTSPALAASTTSPGSVEPSASTEATAPSASTMAPSSSATVPATGGAQAPECVVPLTITEQIALLVWPSVYASDWSTARATVAEHQLGGVLLMKPSGWDADTLRERLGELEQGAAHGLVVATDEEGGEVQRLGELWPLASQFEVSTKMDSAAAGRLIAAHAALVADVGVDVVLGPVVDVLPTSGDPPLRRSRFFAGTPDDVAEFASAYIDAWRQAGIEPVLKHFPGHGDASGDTHVGDGITAPLDALEQRDLAPYRALAGSGVGVMVGHLTTPGLTGDVPASRSADAVEYLREQLGYGDALIVSDSLDMDAVGVPVPQAAVESLRAGVDVVLFTDPTITGEVIGAIQSAVGAGSLPPERVEAAAAKVWRLLGGLDPGC